MPKAPKTKFYAVSIGRGGPKIYNTWDECNEKVSRFPGARHRSFPSRSQAEIWLASNSQDIAMPSESQNLDLLQVTQPNLSEQPVKTDDDIPVPPPEISLSAEQSLVLRRVKEGRSVFFTGSAGTGKSVLLREIINALDSDTLGITASTGIAAVNIGGTTLHSWAGIGLGQEDAKRLVGKFFGQPKFKPVLERWQRANSLIIDEISMIDGILFDKLEYIARELRHNELPFGGIQLILSGDFCQLPPVPGRTAKGEEIPSVFAFDAGTWDSCVGPPVTLTKVFRQKDQAFVDMLNAMRFGKMDPRTIEAFKGLGRTVRYTDGIEPTELYSTRREVDSANFNRLRALNIESHIYNAQEYPGVNSYGEKVTQLQMEKLLERLIVPKSIELKVGAQVMLVKNLIPGVLVNGSVGKVVKFSTPADAIKEHTEIAKSQKGKGNHVTDLEITGPSWPVVRFINGREMMCVPQEFTVNNADGSMEARRDQVPLILAWSLSVHKSQGQTLERVKVDLRRTFEKGQAYVALSRATSMESLQVLNFNAGKVVAHPRVLEWHDQGANSHGGILFEEDEMDDMDNGEAMAAYYDMA